MSLRNFKEIVKSNCLTSIEFMCSFFRRCTSEGMIRTALIAVIIYVLPFDLPGVNIRTEAIFSGTAVTTDQDGLIALTIDSPEEIAGLEFSLEYDAEKLLLGKPEFSSANQHFFVYTTRDSNELKVVAFTLEGKRLDLSGPVMTIPLSTASDFEGTVELKINQFVASDPNGSTINLRVSAGRIYILPSLPEVLRLTQNFPNPFNAETVIRFELPENAIIHLAIYNVLGQRIRELEAQIVPAGFYSVIWDGKDDLGEAVSSGEYVCSLKVGINYHAMKIVLLR